MSGSADPSLPLKPRMTPSCIGHDAAEAAILSAWNSGRMPHAWLIGGPPGIGKATFAYRVARFVLAQSSPAGDGLFGDCGVPGRLDIDQDHPVFRRVAAGSHADLITIERQRDEKKGRLKRDIAVDDVRRIAPFLHHTSAEGGWRVAIVDGADRMNSNGLNAILKILEEPPTHALLLLVCESPGGMLPTIRSRCRKLTLRPLSEDQTVSILKNTRPGLSEADVMALARLTDGSVGRAIELADAGGLALYHELVTVLATLPRVNIPAATAFVDGLARRGDEGAFDTAMDLLVWWVGRMARSIACGVAPTPVIADEEAMLQGLIGRTGLDRWLEVWEKTGLQFSRAEGANLDRKLVVLNALLSLESVVS